MIPFREPAWVNIIIRDVFQITFIGLIIPATYIVNSGSSLSEFGITKKRWWLYLPINVILAGLLLLLFLKDSPPNGSKPWDYSQIYISIYVFLVLIFEVVFFYSFLRTLLERSFGVIPAIVLTSLFYSLHHAGFQPEFIKLFFVGLIYATAFRLADSALVIFPFFIGVGGLYDVLVQSEVVTMPLYPGIRSIYLTIAIAGVTMFVIKGIIGRNKAAEDLLRDGISS